MCILVQEVLCCYNSSLTKPIVKDDSVPLFFHTLPTRSLGDLDFKEPKRFVEGEGGIMECG